MNNFIRKSRLVFVLTLAVLSACSNSSASKSDDSAGTTDTTTTTFPVSTTVPWQKGAPEAAWAAWLTTFAVVDASEISESEFQKALYIIQENARVQKAAKMIKDDNISGLGELLFEAHKGARDQFKISCKNCQKIYQPRTSFPRPDRRREYGADKGS